MGAPQIIVIVLWAIGLGVHISRHGQTKKPGEYDAVVHLIAIGIWAALLWWGGFF